MASMETGVDEALGVVDFLDGKEVVAGEEGRENLIASIFEEVLPVLVLLAVGAIGLDLRREIERWRALAGAEVDFGLKSQGSGGGGL